jgi:hypothetical protein
MGFILFLSSHYCNFRLLYSFLLLTATIGVAQLIMSLLQSIDPSVDFDILYTVTAWNQAVVADFVHLRWICLSQWQLNLGHITPVQDRRSFTQIEQELYFQEDWLCLYHLYAYQSIRNVAILTRKFNHLYGITATEEEVEDSLSLMFARMLVQLNFDEQMHKTKSRLQNGHSAGADEPAWWHWAMLAAGEEAKIMRTCSRKGVRYPERSQYIPPGRHYAGGSETSDEEFEGSGSSDAGPKIFDERPDEIATLLRQARPPVEGGPTPQQQKKIDELFGYCKFEYRNHEKYPRYRILYNTHGFKDIEDVRVSTALLFRIGSPKYYRCLGVRRKILHVEGSISWRE